METLRLQCVPGMPNPIDELNADITALQKDMLLNPGHKDEDQNLIDIDQKELDLENQMRTWMKGDQSYTSVLGNLSTQLMNEEMLRAQIGGKSPLESLSILKNDFIGKMIDMIRDKDPNFAPMGTSEGKKALAKLGDIFDQLIGDPTLLAQYLQDPSIVESLL